MDLSGIGDQMTSLLDENNNDNDNEDGNRDEINIKIHNDDLHDHGSLQSPSSSSSDSMVSQTERDYECLICFYPFYSKDSQQLTTDKLCICPSCAATYHKKCIYNWNNAQHKNSKYGLVDNYYGCPNCRYQGNLMYPDKYAHRQKRIIEMNKYIIK